MALNDADVIFFSDPSNPDKSQDVWVRFDEGRTAKIEGAFKQGKKKVVVDAERFVDLSDWQQKRKDDEEVSEEATEQGLELILSPAPPRRISQYRAACRLKAKRQFKKKQNGR